MNDSLDTIIPFAAVAAFICIVLFLCWCVGRFAENRGGSFLLGFLSSFFLSPILGFFIVFLITSNYRSDPVIAGRMTSEELLRSEQIRLQMRRTELRWKMFSNLLYLGIFAGAGYFFYKHPEPLIRIRDAVFPSMSQAQQPLAETPDRLAQPPPPLPTGKAVSDFYQTLVVGSTTYSDVTVKTVFPDSMAIIHSSGALTIPLADVPKDIQTKYHYDPTSAAEYASLKVSHAQYRIGQQGQRTSSTIDLPKYGFTIEALDSLPSSTVSTAALMTMLPVSDGFAPNVNVNIQPYSESIASYVVMSKDEIKKMDAVIIREKKNGQTEWICEYTGLMQGNDLHFYQRAILSRGKVYLVTATSTQSQWSSVSEALRKCVDSLKTK